ncbi:unnamed protein product [Tilletia controversa]|uniref:Large ribosomal subunit protein bL21m n=3 Tax=Tilletia TaxID=13289 RepID=A0A8X7SXR2_9BASI|nr:hypothetical protein CF336_g3138 [Tilletia laevis]KAE8200524.1 hypothetical protein CF328_g2937 [Tilletia controversa]KAE8264123.1 hypothetical protein A4X03_0g1179 [Tilletia caries]KAE8205572.1 hypothetical protein CF335_g2259 [Tilletia laevis]KAE8248472.1 hypothetical protein A4X06_0g3687 [Tilletia controversa]
MSLSRSVAPLARTSLAACSSTATSLPDTVRRSAAFPSTAGSKRTLTRSATSQEPAAAAPAHPTADSLPPSQPLPSASSLPASTAVSSTSQALAALRTQPQHYVIASLVGRAFLLSLSDVVTLPRLKDVRVGDVLELERVHEIGSQDYTLRAQDPISPRVRTEHYAANGVDPLEGANSTTKWTSRLIPAGLAFTGAVLRPETVRVRCLVVEHTKGKMEYIVKKKRRKGYRKTIKHKQPYTRLRVEEIRLGDS